MIPFKQSLVLKRLVVLKSGGSLYDQEFHVGVNIIRGENTSGKSTIADFIFFALGGDLSEWTPEAESADTVHAEVLLGGRTFTLSRDIDRVGHPAMYIFDGTFDEALERRGSWLKYPYSRSANTESFSQVLFRLLGLPEQKTDAQQNITMHQILRLLYCDQMTPVDEIFRKEKFDTRDIRLAISDLLLGLDDFQLHDLRFKIRDMDRKYGELVGELRSIFSILGKTGASDVAFLDFEREKQALIDERESALEKMEALSSQKDSSTRASAVKRLDEVSNTLRGVNDELAKLREQEGELTLDIEDSRGFISTLHERIEALDASRGMAELLGTATFTMCPACLSPVSVSVDDKKCQLCKSDLHKKIGWGGHLKMREELVFQERESTQLLENKLEERTALMERLVSLRRQQKRLLADVAEFARRVDPIDAEIGNLAKRIGYLDKSIEGVTQRAELAAIVKGKVEERDSLGAKLQTLRNNLEDFSGAQKKRRDDVTYKLMELCLDALHRDLPMEEVFVNSEMVDFNFGTNRMAVNGRTRFSASSATYLKNAFLFSLFELSLLDDEVRWPRFILLDNIEDKGMQPKRSANFQEYVVERSSKSSEQHQIIITTSMISPALEDSSLCVGPHYTENNKSLGFVKAQ